MNRPTTRGLLIVVGIAILFTVFTSASSLVANALFGAITLVFICLMWYFGYSWYRQNRMAISLMSERQRATMYAGMAAASFAGAVYSLSKFDLLDIAGFELPLLLLFAAGIGAMVYAWNESKRYYL